MDNQVAFRTHPRRILNLIQATHGENAVINLFPALPTSATVEMGRVWMLKTDLPIRVFDQNRIVGSFIPTIERKPT